MISGRAVTTSRRAGGALGDPGALIQQAGDFQEWRQIDGLGGEQRHRAAIQAGSPAGRTDASMSATAIRVTAGSGERRGNPAGGGREYGSAASYPRSHAAPPARRPRCGRTPKPCRRIGRPAPCPVAEIAPIVGFSPTMLPNAAGTRPDPAVSVPSAKSTIPAATATPEPDDDPPGTCAALNTLRGVPYGLRTPTSPVAN